MKRNVGLAFGVILLGALVMAQMTYLPMTTKVVTVCTAGCRYTSLNAACAANTSTAAAPIEYRVGPGVYVGQISCSGEDHASFIGSGRGTTTLQYDTTTALDGVFKPGTSSNYLFTGFTVKGKIYQDLNGTNGGTIVWRGNQFLSSDAFGDNDCTIMDRPGAGTRLFREDNECRTTTDGHTCARDCANVDIYDKDNTYGAIFASSANNATMKMVRFNSTPCLYVDQGSTIILSAARTDGAMETHGYYYEGTESTGNCAGTGRAFISGVTSQITNTTSNQSGSAASFVEIASGADELDELYLQGVHSTVAATDPGADDTVVRNVVISNATTVAYVSGGQYISSGGLLNLDFADLDASDINVAASIYTSGDVTAADQNRLRATVSTDFQGPVTLTDNAGQTTNLVLNTLAVPRTMLTLDNTDETANAASPALAWCNSTTAAGQDCWKAFIASNGVVSFSDLSGTVFADFYPPIGEFRTHGHIIAYASGTDITIGDGSASDSNKIAFDAGTTDASIIWNDTNDRLEFTGATVYRHATLATAPASCSIGDIYFDTSGAFCVCSSSNTWTNTDGVGSCV